MNNGDTLNLSWTKVKYCHHIMLSICSSRQPTDPDNLAEHWGPTPDSHRLADTTQAGCLNTDDMPTFEPPLTCTMYIRCTKGCLNLRETVCVE